MVGMLPEKMDTAFAGGQRVEWIDIGKAIGIIMVVLYHSLDESLSTF